MPGSLSVLSIDIKQVGKAGARPPTHPGFQIARFFQRNMSYRLTLNTFQCLIDVPEDIFNILQPDAQADKIG